MTRVPALLASLILLCACGEAPTEPPLPPEPEPDPCDVPGACEVAGVDLVFDSVWLDFDTNRPLHPEFGVPILQNFDSIPLGFIVRNRGDETSDSTDAYASTGRNGKFVPVAPLDPGELAESLAWLPLDTRSNHRIHTPYVWFMNDAVDEPFHRNDRREAPDSFYVAAPVLAGELTMLSGELRADAPLELATRLVNTDPYGILRDTTTLVCLVLPQQSTCTAAGSLPALQPGAEHRDTLAIVVPRSSDYRTWHRAVPDVDVRLCVESPDALGRQLCGGSLRGTVLPDVEKACTIGRIVAGVPANVNQTCYPGHYVVSFEALAGYDYTVQLSGEHAAQTTISIWDRDGAQYGTAGLGNINVTLPAAGRYYIVLAYINATEYVLNLTEAAP